MRVIFYKKLLDTFMFYDHIYLKHSEADHTEIRISGQISQFGPEIALLL
jgi:hypothetical protein